MRILITFILAFPNHVKGSEGRYHHARFLHKRSLSGFELLLLFLKNGPFLASFSLFSSFQYTVDSRQMFNINNFLPMTGFELRTSGIRCNCSTNLATQPLLLLLIPSPSFAFYQNLTYLLGCPLLKSTSNNYLMKEICFVANTNYVKINLM